MNFKNIKIINILNIIIWLFISVFITYKLRYACVIHDDIKDIIITPFLLEHGRIVMDFILTVFIKYIPELFHIHYQDFAIVSEAVLKAVFIATLSYLTAIAYNRFSKKDTPFPIMIPAFFIISFLFFIAVLQKNGFFWSFENSQYHTGYFSAVIFYLLFWYKLFDFYNFKSIYPKRDCVLFVIFAMIAQTSNEQLNIVLIFILFCILVETIIKYFKGNQNDKSYFVSRIKLLFSTIIVMTAMSIFLYTTKYSVELYNQYISSSINFHPDLKTLYHFAFEIYHKIIVQNILIILPLVLNIVYIYLNREKETSQPLKYIIYTLSGFSFFVAGTIFLPQNCYAVQDDVVYPFWFCAMTMLIPMIICLYAVLLFSTGVAVSTEKSGIEKYIKIFFVTVCILTMTILHIKPFNSDITDFKTRKELLYKFDKMAVFYFKQNKTAILPNTIPVFMYENEIDYKDLQKINPDKIYYEEDSPYLLYIHHIYNIDVSSGVRFIEPEKAINEFYENGGSFSKEELKNIRFSNIK